MGNPCKLITPTQPGKSLYKINPIRLSKEIDKECGALKSVKKIGKSLAVVCYNSKRAQRLKNMTTLCGVDVGVAPETPQTKGVIVGVDLDITEDELLDELSDQITQAKRITRRSGGDVTPTKAVVLWFATNNLPPTINIGYELKKVLAYRPPVARCYNCQRFGHSALRCNAKIRCSRCSLNHKWEQCPNKKETPKCANCGGITVPRIWVVVNTKRQRIFRQSLTNKSLATRKHPKNILKTTKMQCLIPSPNRNL